MFPRLLRPGSRGRIWKILQRAVSVCLLVVIVLLLFRAGDFSTQARDFIQDRLTELGIAQQN
jgi:hypothetical protein